MATQWFHFRQNNSFGRFQGPKNVFVEALDADEANFFATKAGVYFDGCQSCEDCPCCGDRWSRVDASDACEQPRAFGMDEPVTGDTLVHRDGRVETVGEVVELVPASPDNKG